MSIPFKKMKIKMTMTDRTRPVRRFPIDNFSFFLAFLSLSIKKRYLGFVIFVCSTCIMKGKVALSRIENLSQTTQFVLLSSGVFFFFGLHNLLQEAMMTIPGFKFGVMLGKHRDTFYSTLMLLSKQI